MHQRYLITGAAGFIGANFVRALLASGAAEVHIFIREKTNLWRIKDVLENLHVHVGDVCDYDSVHSIMRDVRPDYIVHLATYGAYLDKELDFRKIVRTNFEGTWNILQSSKEIDYQSLIVAGSSSEYGVSEKPMNEEDLLEPLSMYGVTKASSSLLTQSFARVHKKNAAVVRLFSVYGYYEEAFRLIPDVILHCLKNKDLDLTEGLQTRDFIFIEDVCEALSRLLERKDLNGEIFNLGTGKQSKIRQVAEKIHCLMGASNQLNFGSKKTRDVEFFNWVADTTKMKNLLNWSPQNSLEMGLEKNIRWFRKNEAIYSASL